MVPVSAGGAQLGVQRPERKKEGLEKVEGDAVCHRSVQIILIKCNNQQLKLKPQLLHSTSTPRLSVVARIGYTGTLAKRRAQVITSKSRVQINLQLSLHKLLK